MCNNKKNELAIVSFVQVKQEASVKTMGWEANHRLGGDWKSWAFPNTT